MVLSVRLCMLRTRLVRRIIYPPGSYRIIGERLRRTLALEGLGILDGSTLRKLFDYKELVNDIRRVLLGNATAPMRASLTHGNAWLGAMPAAGLGLQVVKVVGVYYDNPSKGLPLVRGLVLVLRESDGEPLYLMDAGVLTGYRTAAATCLGVGLLGYEGQEPVGLIGSGVQARYHAECLKDAYRVRDFLVYDIDSERASSLARELGGRTASLEEIHSMARLIVAATTSREPVVRGSLLRDDAVVASVGAPKPVWEVDEEAMERAGCILADTIEGFLEEAGEAEHKPASVKVVGLREALQGAICPGRGPRIYKSVGTGLFDLAAAYHIHRKKTGLEAGSTPA